MATDSYQSLPPALGGFTWDTKGVGARVSRPRKFIQDWRELRTIPGPVLERSGEVLVQLPFPTDGSRQLAE